MTAPHKSATMITINPAAKSFHGARSSAVITINSESGMTRRYGIRCSKQSGQGKIFRTFSKYQAPTRGAGHEDNQRRNGRWIAEAPIDPSLLDSKCLLHRILVHPKMRQYHGCYVLSTLTQIKVQFVAPPRITLEYMCRCRTRQRALPPKADMDQLAESVWAAMKANDSRECRGAATMKVPWTFIR